MMVQRLAARGAAGGAGGRGLLRIHRSSTTTNALAPALRASSAAMLAPAARACCSTTAIPIQRLPTTRRPLARRAAPMPLPHRSLRSVAAAASSSSSSGGDRDTFTITTPLFYVNAAPHMGSAYPTIAADVVARYQRLRGRRVRFVTGTDEHGEKIALAAAARSLEPQEHCDQVAAQYKALWEAVSV
jgi:methionyl-tRNA synthetase